MLNRRGYFIVMVGNVGWYLINRDISTCTWIPRQRIAIIVVFKGYPQACPNCKSRSIQYGIGLKGLWWYRTSSQARILRMDVGYDARER